MEREEWGEGREKNSKVEVVREIDRFFFFKFFIFFNLVTSRTSSGAVDGAVESAMAGKLRTKKEKVMMTKVDG